MHTVVRVDGGPEIGYGHLIRSGSLAEELLTRGHTVTVATTTPTRAESILPASIETIELPTRSDAEPFVEWIDSASPDVVFTDAYPVDTAYQCAVRDRLPLAVLQDDNRHPVAADLFVNGNLYAADLEYEFVGQPPRRCLGTEYILLRREIRTVAAGEPPWRDTPERALITTGGGDPTDLTPTVVEAFDGCDLRVDTIVGPGVSESQEQTIRAAAATVSAEIDVVRDPDDLPDRMFQADFAISTASSTTYELLALGTPIVSVPVVENQQHIATALNRRDAATVVDPRAGTAGLRDAIDEYRSDASLRRERRQFGRSLVDKCGVKRLADQLVSL